MTLFAIEGSAIFLTLLFFFVPPSGAGWNGLAPWCLKALAVTVALLGAFYFNSLYDLRIVRSFKDFLSRLSPLLALACVFLIPMNAPYLSPFSGARLALSLVAAFLLVVLARALFYQVILSPRFTRRVVVLGINSLAQEIVKEIESQPHLRYTVVGVIDDGVLKKTLPNYPVLGSSEHLGKIVEEIRPHRIIVAMADRWRLPVRELLECRLRGIVVEDGVEVYERLTGKFPIEWLTPGQLIFSKDLQKSSLALTVGRALSFIVAAVALVFFAPLLGLIALAVKLDSRGPVFLIQERVGWGGRPFRLLKFRTMHPIAGDAPLWFSEETNRVTRVGKWLRMFRLDELPQFVNLLRGDMNLVGPRPHREPKLKLLALVWRNAPECGQPIPYHSLRCMVPPGMTGWAQVRYRYAGDLEEETEKVRYDLYYVKHRSLWLDLRILLDTIKIVFSGRGSATTPAYRPETVPGRPQGELHRAA